MSGDPLLASRVEAALGQLGAEQDPLRISVRLSRELGEALGREAATLLALRRRARGKLPLAERLALSAKGLEQASDRAVSRARTPPRAVRSPW